MRNIRIPQVFTLILFILSSKYVSKEYIKEKSILDFLQNAFNLLGYSDSNQEKQDQNLLCYHYTISQFSYQNTRFDFDAAKIRLFI